MTAAPETKPVESGVTVQVAVRKHLAAFKPKFRGEIWENTASVPMGRGYANDGKPFDIESACYLKPVLRAIKDPNVPVVCAFAAVQMLKTFACIEEPAAYFIEHEPGDMTIYIGGDNTARDQARSRLLPRLRDIPGVGKLIREAESANRFDINTQELYLPGMTLRIWGLNETSTQRITLRRVLGSDLFLSKSSGLWKQAMARATQHWPNCKIIGESQGGEEGDDFDSFWKTTDMGMLHVKCPLCGTGQPFEFQRERSLRSATGEEFRAVAPFSVPSLDRDAWIAHHTPLLLKDDARYSGFNRGDDDLIKRADGGYNEAEVLKQTHYTCFHCGGRWDDNPPTRKALDESSYYVPSNPHALPGHAGFNWPAWAGQRLAWGGEYVMLGRLRAIEKKRRLGNVEDLKQWYQKRAARAWRPDLDRVLRKSVQEAYDALKAWPEEWRRCLVVDNQHELQTQWASVFAVARDGRARQLWRGPLKGFGSPNKKWEEQPETVAGVQKKFSIKDQWVFMDCAYMLQAVVDECAKHGHWATIGGERTWLCWNALRGSKWQDFAHADEKNPKLRFPVADPVEELRQLGNFTCTVLRFEFSALKCSDMAAARRDGLGMEFLTLAETENPDNELSWTAQMNSMKRETVISKHSGMSGDIWLPLKQGTPTHYFDIVKMFCAVLCIWEVDGLFEPEKADTVAKATD